MDDKKNPRAVEDFKEGLEGHDQEGLLSSRSKENEEGLKENAKLEEQEKRQAESDDNEDD